MKISQQYSELQILLAEINKRLGNLNFQAIKELILWLEQNPMYKKLKQKENQLRMLDCFCSIWLEEKKELEKLGIHEDIFYGIHSLEDVERKYLAIKYCGLRIENKVPIVYCQQAAEELIRWKVSGIAISRIFISETYKREENVVQISQLLKERQQLITVIILLQEGLKVYKENENILLELAECWITAQQWYQALVCLKQIKNPKEEISELINELEKVVGNEVI